MTRDNIINRYFEWLCVLVSSSKYEKRGSYRQLLYALHNTEFVYSLDMDENRAIDGAYMRRRFGIEHSLKEQVIIDFLDDRPCSILEMMVALASRCEVQIMDNPNMGDRTDVWFWGMIDNLGLSAMAGRSFDKEYVRTTLDDFLNHRYNRNGYGGLFTVNKVSRDMRTVDIWYQMCWYLNEYMKK